MTRLGMEPWFKRPEIFKKDDDDLPNHAFYLTMGKQFRDYGLEEKPPEDKPTPG